MPELKTIRATLTDHAHDTFLLWLKTADLLKAEPVFMVYKIGDDICMAPNASIFHAINELGRAEGRPLPDTIKRALAEIISYWIKEALP